MFWDLVIQKQNWVTWFQGKNQDASDLSPRKEVQVVPTLVILSLVVGTFFLYKPVLGYGFINFDDPLYVTDNENVLEGLRWANIKWAFSTSYGFYHPITWLSLMADATFKPQGAPVFHLTNIWIHIMNAVSVFFITSKLLENPWAAAVTSFLFAWHPINVETVVWIAERKGLLGAFFALLAVDRFLTFQLKASWFSYFCSLLAFAASLLCKPVALALPVVFLALQLVRKSNIRTKLSYILTPFFVCSIAGTVVAYNAQLTANAISTDLSTQAVFSIVFNYFWYLGKLFLLGPYCLFYPRKEIEFLPFVFSSIGLLLVLLYVKKRPYMWLGLLCFMILLLPVVGFCQIGEHRAADRYTYLPGIALFIGITSSMKTVVQSLQSQKFQEITVLGTIGLVTLLAVLTKHQITIWSDQRSLYTHALRHDNENSVMYCNLGAFLQTEGDIGEAAKCYKNALFIDPSNPHALNNLGILHARKQNAGMAKKYLQKAVLLHYDYAPAFHNLAAVMFKLTDNTSDDLHEARAYARKACLISDFQNIEYLDNYLQILLRMNAVNEAKSLAESCFRISLQKQDWQEATRYDLLLHALKNNSLSDVNSGYLIPTLK